MRKVLMFPLLLVLPIALLGCKFQQQASTLEPLTAVASNAPSAAPMSGRQFTVVPIRSRSFPSFPSLLNHIQRHVQLDDFPAGFVGRGRVLDRLAVAQNQPVLRRE